jgi:hypothetical protein
MPGKFERDLEPAQRGVRAFGSDRCQYGRSEPHGATVRPVAGAFLPVR